MLSNMIIKVRYVHLRLLIISTLSYFLLGLPIANKESVMRNIELFNSNNYMLLAIILDTVKHTVAVNLMMLLMEVIINYELSVSRLCYLLQLILVFLGYPV